MQRLSRPAVAVAGAALAVAAIAVGVPMLTGGEARPPSVQSHRQRTPLQPFEPTTDIDRLVVRDGDTVRGTGEVVALPHRAVRLCAPVPEALTGREDDSRFRYCRIGVDLSHVDLDRLSHRVRRRSDGAVVGNAQVVGRYRHGILAVTEQRRPTSRMYDGLPKPPCAPPDGGWPRGRRTENLPMDTVVNYRHAHPRSILDNALLRPSMNQVVAYVVTVRDPAAVRAALRATYGRRLCVVRSRWTRAQLTTAQRAIVRLSDASGERLRRPVSYGRSFARDGQPQAFVDMLLVTPSAAHRLSRLPHGIVRASAWLTPQ